jgi:hypothetical protein
MTILVENASRPTALGKKNWLFFGHAEAGERSAIIYTLIESCRRRGIDPYAYLRDVLTHLPMRPTGRSKTSPLKPGPRPNARRLWQPPRNRS